MMCSIWLNQSFNAFKLFILDVGLLSAMSGLDLKSLPKHAVRTSMSDYRQEDWLTNIPLYAVNFLADILQ